MTHSRFLKIVLSMLISMQMSFLSFGQLSNEWFDSSQRYFTFKIGQNGVYRLNYNTLLSHGIPVDDINPKNIQIFKNGEEQYLYVYGQEDNNFDADDFIEFYATKNDGSLDTELYKESSNQPNSYQSLFTDTSTYYLTWNSDVLNKRIVTYYDNDYEGKTADSYFINEQIISFKDYFFPGIPNQNNSSQQFSEYTDGEGFGRWIWSSQPAFELDFPQVFSNGPNAEFEILAFSANHNTSEVSNGYNHELALSLDNKANTLASQKAFGYQRIQLNASTDPSNLKPVTSLYIGESNYNKSAFVLSYIKCNYPRLLNLNNNSQLRVNGSFNSSFFNFSDYPLSKNNPYVIDLSNNKRIKADKQGDQSIKFNIEKNGIAEFYIYDTSDVITITSIEEVKLGKSAINQSTDYLIITHPNLASGASNYASYRMSNTGGNHATSTIYVNDIYHDFGYGIEGPLAIKKYIQSLKSSAPNLQYILLLGKGQTYDRIRTNTDLKTALNLVPSIGFPPSDYLYVSSLDVSDLGLDFSIGRIPSRNNEQVEIYLDKIRAFEAQPPATWQKKVIQLAGGIGFENQSFKNYLNNYYTILSDTSYGGYRVMFSKSEPLPIQTSLTSKIQAEVNDGSNMLMYFGHGAAQVTEISLGEPSEYNNYGKTPLFFFNGCALGNTFEDLSLAEKFLFEPNKGALGWIASTNLSFTSQLYSHSLEIHKKLFQDNYGESIASAIKAASKTFGNIDRPLDVIQSRQLVYHGDPAFSLKSPNFPDFKFSQVSVGNATRGDSLSIIAQINNIGKAVSKTLSIHCKITSNGQSVFTNKLNISTPYFQKIIEFKVPQNILSGLIDIQLELDSANSIQEILPNGELNNTYTTKYLIKQISPTILKPSSDEIISNTSVEVMLQLPGNTDITREIIVEWDSTPYFKNPIDRNQFNHDKTLIKTEVIFPDIDSKDYYIRARYIEKGDTSDWAYRTFGIIKDDPQGWTEGSRWKFFNSSKNAISVDSNTGRFDFLRTTSKDYQIETGGSGLGKYTSRWIIIDGTPVITNWWPFKGVSMIFINPDTDERYHEPSNSFNVPFKAPWFGTTPPPYNVVGEPCAMYNYNTNTIEEQDSLIDLLNRVPNGYHIIMLNMSDCNTELYKQELWDAFSAYGITKLQTIKKGEPFGVFGTKGSDKPANEYLADYQNSVTPPENQTMKYNQTFSPKLIKGSITSKSIGPAVKWETLTLELDQKDANNETFNVEIFASSDNKNWESKLTSSNFKIIDLGSIDAKIHPFIQVKISFSDDEMRTPQSISRWKINYKKPVEGTINKDLTFKFYNDTLQQGEDLTYSISFENIEDQVFDSSEYVIYIKNSSGINDTITRNYIDSILPLQHISIQDTIQTFNMEGEYEFFVGFNHQQEVVEQTYDNNYFNKQFFVDKDVTNPLLDVVFDGKHIIDYDIVSPNTIISISIKDDNAYRLIDDASYISAYLKHPNGEIDTLQEGMEQVEFTPSTQKDEEAILKYSARNLETGSYTLSVEATDKTGNESSEMGYSINFEVIREASITNFYPYPNPASSSVQFVYTLTGDQVPDYIKIQIMTVSGKIVREITQNELGYIQIGNNISDFAWDCTDRYGDRLANGVYLYKVKARLNGKDMEIRKTSGDHFFSNGFGKLYLVK